MNLTARAVVVTHQGRPAPDVDVELCTVGVRGPTEVATATTDRRGRVTFEAELEGIEVQPRLLLRTRVRRRVVPLSDAPHTFKGSRADFGTVRLPAPEQVATREALDEWKRGRTRLLELVNRDPGRVLEGASPQEIEGRVEERLEDERASLRSEIEGEMNERLNEERVRLQAELRDEMLDQVREERTRRQEAERRAEKLRAERGDLQERVNGLTAELEDLHAETERLREGAELPSGVEGLVLSSQLQLQQADAKIRRTGGPYRLGKVSFNAKVIPDEEGKGLRLPTAEELREYTGPFSEVNYDFTPGRTPDEEEGVSRLPNLLGLTEELARLRAREAGFGLQARSATVPADSPRIGQVIRQVPAPTSDKELPSGSTITVLIGRPIEPSAGSDK